MPIQLSAWFILLLLFENLWKCYFWQSRDFKFPKFSHSVPSMVVPRSSSLPDHVHVSQIINCPCCIMFNFIQPYIPNREHLIWGGGGHQHQNRPKGLFIWKWASPGTWANSFPQDEFHHMFTWNFWGGLACENKYKFLRESLSMHTKTLFYLKAESAQENAFIWKTTQPVYLRSRVTRSRTSVRRASLVLI
jgi:hypothetical protein